MFILYGGRSRTARFHFFIRFRMSQQSRTRVVQILGPAFSIAVMTLLLASCTSTNATTDGSSSSSTAAMTDTSSSAMGMASSAQEQTNNSTYKDGTYSAVGAYASPAGGEQVDVSLTLKNDIITDATFTGEAKFGKSQMMQNNFAAGYKTLVVGKSIDSLSLGVVNGSSLTPHGFMDAVEKIKVEAKA